MNSNKTVLSALYAVIFTVTVQAQILPTASPLQVSEHTLSNGMTVWLNEDHSQPKVFGAVVVNAGAKDCPNTGIAHYFEHILFKGTEDMGTVDYAAEKPWLDSISACYDQLALARDAGERIALQRRINLFSQRAGEYAIPNEFNRLISLYGGSHLNAATSWDYTYYHNTFTPQYMEQWCHLNSHRFISPVFRLFQGELETVYEEKNMYADDMLSVAGEHILGELFGTLPYAYPIIGSTENLKNPRLSEMREFYSKYYVGCNMGIVLCGDFQSDSIMPLLERTFGRIPRGVPPVHVKSPLPDITRERTVEVKLPIPIVGIEILAYKAPTEYEPDANALSLGIQMLSNGQAGMLDSLTNNGDMMMCLALTESLNDAGVAGVLMVPNLLGSLSKAEKTCLRQIKRLKTGDFSDRSFLIQRQEFYRESCRPLETIDDRAECMVRVMGSGHTWQEYLDKINGINALTRADVTSAAKRYFGAPFVRFKKKKGDYPKDKVSQPGYTPIVPKNRNAESPYAKELSQFPVPAPNPRLIDFNSDATITPLGGAATLYTVDNTVNNLFELTISYNRGLSADRRLEATCDFLNNACTDSLTRQQFASSMQELGSDITFSADQSSFKILIVGIDENFDKTLRLAGHYLSHAKASPTTLSQMYDGKKASLKSENKDNGEVMKALRLRVMFGDKSTYLNRLTASEMKKMREQEILEPLEQVTSSACNIIYSGTLSASDVSASLMSHLPISRSVEPYKDYETDALYYEEPTVFVYDMPKSRQTLFFTYEQQPALPTLESRVPFMLFKEYFGGGMSSVMFQEVREFRSMAYSAGSFYTLRPRGIAADAPLAFGTVTGTQGDKAMEAIALVDSLLRDMPLSEGNFETTRRSCINSLNANFPSFRDIGIRIAMLRSNGYDRDNNTGLAELYEAATMDDMKNYYEKNIRHNGNHRVLGIVGDKSRLDMTALSRYGRVVLLHESDIFRK